jgi:hypothetical protein
VRRRTLAFLAVTIACAAAAGGYVAWVASDDADATAGAPAADVASVTGGAHIVFLNLDRRRSRPYSGLAVAPLEKPNATRVVTGLKCQRIHVAAGRGLCLGWEPGFVGVKTRATILDEQFRPLARLEVPGVPSRARVSPDGRYAASTTFVAGDSYLREGGFSTRTTLFDLQARRAIANLEDFAVTRNGKRFKSVDFNFWGVTFTPDAKHFYATLGTGEQQFLVRGDVQARTAVVLRDKVECPSLSPDGKRLAFKKPFGKGSDRIWRFHVLDLETMRETPLTEERSIDDQIEWLDNDSVLYRTAESIWTVRADGKGFPREFLPKADSPAVART